MEDHQENDDNACIRLFQTNPELAYATFVEKCNALTSQAKGVIAIVKFLSSECDVDSVSTRQSLLNMCAPDKPSWEDLAGARLSCDLEQHELIAIKPTNATHEIEISIRVKKSSGNKYARDKEKHTEVKQFLHNLYKATEKTLAKNERPKKGTSITFIGRSLFHFFGVPENCCSLVIAKHHIRFNSFALRKEKVRVLVRMCKQNNQFCVGTKCLTQFFLKDSHKLNDPGADSSYIKKRKAEDIYHNDNGYEDSESSDNESCGTTKSCRDGMSASSSADNSKPDKLPTNQQDGVDYLKNYISQDYQFAQILQKIAIQAQNNGSSFTSTMKNISNDCPLNYDTDHETFIDGSSGPLRLVRLSPADFCPIAIAIDNFFDADEIEAFLRAMDSVFFMKGAGGRADSFIRIVTLDNADNTFFHIGQKLYPCLCASDYEIALIALINRIIEIQNKLYCGGSFGGKNSTYKPHICKINALQIVIEYITSNSGYGLHSDYGKLLNQVGSLLEIDSPIVSRSDLESANRLPLREEMQTFTAVITTCSDSNTITHRLVFCDENENELASLKLNGNMLHAQLHGSQMFRHKVEYCGTEKHEQYSMRIVLSGRFTKPTSPAELKSAFGPEYKDHILKSNLYNQTCVVRELSLGNNPITVSHDNTNENTNVSIDTEERSDENPVSPKIKAAELSDSWKQVKSSVFTSMQLHRADSTFKYTDVPPWKFLSNAQVVRSIALSFGLIPEIIFDDPRKKGQKIKLQTLFTRPSLSQHSLSTISRLLMPLEAIPRISLVSAGFTSHCARSHPLCPGLQEETNMLCLSKPYKNDTETISRYVDHLLTYYRQNRSSTFFTTETPTNGSSSMWPTIKIFGSGGAPHSLDTHTLNLATTDKSQAASAIACPQSTETNNQNKILSTLCDRQGTVALFINLEQFIGFLPEDTFDYLKVDNHSESMLFLGYFYLNNYRRSYLTPIQLQETVNRILSGTNGRLGDQRKNEFSIYSLFRTDYHLQFYLVPLFGSWEEYRELNTRNESGGFVNFPVCFHNRNKISARLPKHLGQADTYPNESFVQQYLWENTELFTEHYEKRNDSQFFNLVVGESGLTDLNLSKGTRIHNNMDILHHLCMVMCAVSLRFLKKNIYYDDQDEGKIGPLPPGVSLSTIYRAHPMPMAIRSYDVMPLLLRSCAIDMGILNNGKLRASSSLLSSEILFISILNRLTGRPRVYLLFRKYFPELSKTIVPPPECLEIFLNFVSANKCHRHLFNQQHINAIPLDFRLHFHVFSSVLRDLSSNAEKILADMRGKDTERSGAVRILGNNLHSFIECHKTQFNERNLLKERYYWLAHQILADLEEIFCDPFGKAESQSVFYGTGAKQGWYVCFGSGPPKDTSGANCGEHKKAQQFLRWLQEFLSEDNATARLYCDALGLEQITDRRSVSVKLNGRELSETDVEHFLCKVYLGACKTISSRATSEFPVSGKSGYHPVKTETTLGLLWDEGELIGILEKCSDAYTCLRRIGAIAKTPDCFLFNDEHDPAPHSGGH